MKIRKLLQLFTVIIILSSCATPKIAYLQDIESGTEQEVYNFINIRLKPEDKISIIVNSKDQMLTNLFNLPYVTQHIGDIKGQTIGSPKGVSGYTIDKDGNIDFPVLGKVHVAGMTREEIAEHIKQELISHDLVKDPVVTVEYMNLTISVLGEVNTPGRFSIDKDRITLFDAISMAGDLTIFGKRDNVTVQREENGKLKLYRVDLTSGYNLYTSPVYYLHQNDVVYIEPNKYKAKESTLNNKAVRWSSIWVAVASLLTTITVAILRYY